MCSLKKKMVDFSATCQPFYHNFYFACKNGNFLSCALLLLHEMSTTFINKQRKLKRIVLYQLFTELLSKAKTNKKFCFQPSHSFLRLQSLIVWVFVSFRFLCIVWVFCFLLYRFRGLIIFSVMRKFSSNFSFSIF